MRTDPSFAAQALQRLRALEQRWRWVLAGAAYGLLLRALFGLLSAASGVMSLSFAVATPMVVGALSVYSQRHTPLAWQQ